jgi:GTP cyclohydrolase I
MRDLNREVPMAVVRALQPESADSTAFRAAVRTILEQVGENPEREGLLKTPERVEKAMRYMTSGYSMNAEEVIGDALFEAESHDNMVIVHDIDFYSMCEHHMLPFFGKAHVAYIPDGKIVGLSKIARVVDVFARRLQVQERLTDQIAAALDAALKPKGVGVVCQAAHFCMQMRGVEKQGAMTSTSALRGVFRDDPRTREEFLRLANARR